MTSRQLPFDLGHAAAYARADFQVSDCNAAALGWVEKWPDWPAPVLIVHGPPGCGKTHLCHIWRKTAGAVPFSEGAQGRAFVLDGTAGFIGNVQAEEALFHLYNRLKEQGGHMLIAAAAPPRDWDFVLPDLQSRLLAAPSVAVAPPDDALLAIILTKIFSDRQILVPQEVVAFLLPRMERTFAAARALAERIDRKALAEKRAVTVPLAREALEEA